MIPKYRRNASSLVAALKEAGEGETGDARLLFQSLILRIRNDIALKQLGKVYRRIDEKSVTSVLFNFAAR
jgi:hypothetical protein